MSRAFKKHIRQLQFWFPVILQLREKFEVKARNLLNLPFDPDFQILQFFPEVPQSIYADIGANSGQSINAIRVYRPEVSVHAFEPNTELFDQIQEEYGQEENVNCYNFGIGEGSSEFTLHIPWYNGRAHSANASFDIDVAREWFKKCMPNYSDNLLSFTSMRCQVRCFDSFDLDPYFMKIDVEGFENQVLEGALKTLQKCEPILLIEGLHYNEAAKKLLQSLSFDCYTNRKGILHPGALGSQNTFAMTAARRKDLPEELFA